ncbi:hypothetical protein Q4534_06930 [Cyclobacterium sp. 1_MG-2023]|uniref:hypothetical protein n=1 Tax=Cyclobacterium sp. 1_MG-2023 TaxID=3062681 RepID=UPI0026E30EE8|nr:hypothetical protein [Cyclobacterium sp. 1_MG-2023]MDO6437130.1 hypothetical protein [Cyclobacterium sp. 1_MG-2023]
MGKFKKGNPGRPKGAKNKINTQMRDLIQSLFDNNYQTIQEDLEALEAKDRLKFLSDLLPYLLPKLQSTTHSQELNFDSMSDEELDILIDRITNE